MNVEFPGQQGCERAACAAAEERQPRGVDIRPFERHPDCRPIRGQVILEVGFRAIAFAVPHPGLVDANEYGVDGRRNRTQHP